MDFTPGRDAVVLRSGGPPTPVGRIRVAAVSPRETAMRERPWRRVDGYAVVMVFRGHGGYRDPSGREEAIGAGDVIVVTPGFEHWYGPPVGSDWGELFVVFEGRAFDLLAEVGILAPARPVLRGRADQPALARMARELAAPQDDGAAGAMADVWRFAATLLDLLGGEAEPERAADDPIVRARRVLERDITASLPLRQVAGAVGLGYERFRHRFAAEVGCSPARYRDAHRIDAARELLRHTALNHRELGAILGFADEFHFSKRFRALAGCSPRQFRWEARGSQGEGSR